MLLYCICSQSQRSKCYTQKLSAMEDWCKGPETNPVATGVFGGLSPTNKAPSPLNWNVKHYKLVEFLSNLNVKAPART